MKDVFIVIVLIWATIGSTTLCWVLKCGWLESRINELENRCVQTEARVRELELMFGHRTGETLP